MTTRTRELDKIDRKILRILQQEGRISFTELGERVGLSTTPAPSAYAGWSAMAPSPVTTRGWTRTISRPACWCSSRSAWPTSPATSSRSSAAPRLLPNVLECHLVSGDFDYLLKARISEMASYRKLLGSTLLTMPHVRESKSYIVMEEVKETLALPIEG